MSMIVTRNGRDARRIDSSGVPAEDFLQDYIARNPEALPFSELREGLRLMVVAREVTTSSGPIDAVAIDGDGRSMSGASPRVEAEDSSARSRQGSLSPELRHTTQ